MTVNAAALKNTMDEFHSVPDVTKYIDNLVLAVGRCEVVPQSCGALAAIVGGTSRILTQKNEPHDRATM